MARAIDAEEYMELLKEQYLHHEAIGDNQIAKAWQGAMQLLYDMPTLTQPNEWVSVEERLPKEHDSIFKKLMAQGKWGPGMFERLSDEVIVAVKFADGTRRSGIARTKDWIWTGLPCVGCPVVTHWMPLPAPPDKE